MHLCCSRARQARATGLNLARSLAMLGIPLAHGDVPGWPMVELRMLP